ncbi:lactate dehydrogenase (plasmid) [Alteromonas sp. I4]|nr:lactate dehydrogenase [Alteromonas sp. I4]
MLRFNPQVTVVMKNGESSRVRQFEQFRMQVGQQLDHDDIIDDPLYCFAYGTDASFYRMTPQLVLRAQSVRDICHILAAARRYGISVTFRAAGTSLSGQAVTDSVLVILSDKWQSLHVRDEGRFISLQPGVIGSQANTVLKPYGRKIGPDPASINTAKIGGIAANNSSGMCCGTVHNSYHTLHSMKLVLADGSVLDTADPLSRDSFRESHAAMLRALASIADEVKGCADLSSLIRTKYRLKNTTGYSMNALLDFDDPIDILQHLMIGSEGTLGFVADITLRTVSDDPFKSTALVFFNSLQSACNAVSELSTLEVGAVELIDRKGLNSVAKMDGMPEGVLLFPEGATALLIEVSHVDRDGLERKQQAIEALAKNWVLLQPLQFTTDPEVAAKYWAVRKGLFPAVGAVREPGTTVIIEDVAFPIDLLAEGVSALHTLLAKYGYDEAVMFGHALAGNLHFVFTQSFENASEVQRYKQFMDDVAKLVAVDYKGSLKAEHGTGRNMAPFVELEWGARAYELMWDLKRILDPDNILNPGVLLNRDNNIHLKNLKSLPQTNPIVDNCIECGFCEPSCPSRNLTLTPRQRITLQREITRLEKSAVNDADRKRLRQLEQGYRFAGEETCAACGLCELRCPVNINTGNLTKFIRSTTRKQQAWFAQFISQHYGKMLGTGRALLGVAESIANIVGRERMAAMSYRVHRLSRGKIPVWRPTIGPGISMSAIHHSQQQAVPDVTRSATKQVVYFPACPGRVSDKQLPETVIKLLGRAGYEVLLPFKEESTCCGMPFDSKGLSDVANNKRQELRNWLSQIPMSTSLYVISDAAPCSSRLSELDDQRFQFIDLVDFLHDHVIDHLNITPVEETIALHVTCSSQRSPSAMKLKTLARRCASQVIEPASVTCCGFAGDKGFTLPALNASALSGLKAELAERCERGFSSSRTCEIGLSEHAGIPYTHIAFLLEEISAGNTRLPLGKKVPASE